MNLPRDKDFKFFVELIVISIFTWVSASLWISGINRYIQGKDFVKKYLILAVISSIISVLVLYVLFNTI